MGTGEILKRGEGHDLCSSSLPVTWIISFIFPFIAFEVVRGLHLEQCSDLWISGLLRV